MAELTFEQKLNVSVNNMADSIGKLSLSQLYGLKSCGKCWTKEIKHWIIEDRLRSTISTDPNVIKADFNEAEKTCLLSELDINE